MTFLGGLSGWITQCILNEFILWSMPIFLLATLFCTANGDNIVESIVLLAIVGILVILSSTTPSIADKVGTGNLWGGYVAFSIAKLGFAYAKAGSFGNNSFN